MHDGTNEWNFTLAFLQNSSHQSTTHNLAKLTETCLEHNTIKGTGIPHILSRVYCPISQFERCISISIRLQMTDNNAFLAASPADLIT